MKLYCPNCDRPLDVVESGVGDLSAECVHCHMGWDGTEIVERLPQAPVGEQARQKSWERAMIRRGAPLV